MLYLSNKDIAENISRKERLSEWRSQYVTLQMLFNSKQALKNWKLEPNFYLAYDVPINGNGVAKSHKITLGAELHF